MQPRLSAECPRCGATLWRMRGRSFELPLACALTAMLFYAITVIAPLLEISTYGEFRLARLETGPDELVTQGFQLVGLLVLAVTVVLPGVLLTILIATLGGLETRLLPINLIRDLFRWYGPLKPWAMADVYLLGFLVAYARLAAIATVHLDTALFSLVGLVLALTFADSSLDPEAVWQEVERRRVDPPARSAAPLAERQMFGCSACGILNHAVTGENCRRCDAVLEYRKMASIPRSWAYVIAGALLYMPANLFPVMSITSLIRTQQYTIMGGIFELYENGLWPFAVLVFLASFLIPMGKLLTLAYMLILTQAASDDHLMGRTSAYRVIDFIGRWSMIDVFMISLLVALVRFGQIYNVQAEFGAPCFAGVVILTMFAVLRFDPRLMWDRAPGTGS